MEPTEVVIENFVAFVFKLNYNDASESYSLTAHHDGPYNINTLEMSRVKAYALGVAVQKYRNLKRTGFFNVTGAMRKTLKNLGYLTNDRVCAVYEAVESTGEVNYLTIIGAHEKP